MLYQDCQHVWYVQTRPAGTAFFNYTLLHDRLPHDKAEAEELLLSTLRVFDRHNCSSPLIEMVRDDVDVGEPGGGDEDTFANALNAHLDDNTPFNSSAYDFTLWSRAER